jgi:hypothetical protein
MLPAPVEQDQLLQQMAAATVERPPLKVPA